MNKDFPRIITLLRKERGLSQKQVSNDLDISQALLSHYEKGIRECGLDFLVKTADYYGVSCDYLLGRTPQRNGATLNIEDIPEYSDNEGEASSRIQMLSILNKKILMNSTAILLDMAAKTASKKLMTSTSNYLMLANYRIFRKLYSGNENNPQALFSVPQTLYSNYSKALMEMEEAKLDNAAKGKKETAGLRTSSDLIAKDFPRESSSLFNLIQYAEKEIKQKL